ncbi:NAD(P)-binding protein [Cutaneotrichosporon oleaginosum]|uniref:NAD(P)-binding protein n=1 Tax=Cutaneotrichosporon oleaginosum TaxID=879819 RepID=A0A0J0XG84_9TREE|nr:NAD(P)-binding protein [Cutaneotrichosporon oleaginosum]KLT40068.1 NAD(P)-binding protein [Cutaneotrichosporon oleaginosum]TXT10402.1 hypothetical protein COLE_04336 [Cutaneotrichosporon oleaginosum]
MASLDFKDLVVLITGAGGGIGAGYSHFYGARGAKVVVNDVSAQSAQKVVDEIKAAGGQAAIAVGSVTEGQKIVDQAVQAFGTVHVLINNAGILRDKSFKKMDDAQWDAVIAVHLKGAYSMTKAVWPLFRQQKFGRVINTSSPAGIYGNMGQANYSAAKMALVAFSKSLSIEGVKYDIRANTIVPLAASAMTQTVMPPEVLKGLNPDFIAPIIGALTARNGPDVRGRIFEVGGGFYSELRWERSKGHLFKTDDTFTPTAIRHEWKKITDFSKDVEYPGDLKAAGRNLMAVIEKQPGLKPNEQGPPPPVDFKGQTVIITGAGAGLGRAYAHLYSKLGANVVVNDVSAQNAEAVVKECEQLGAKAAAAVCSAEEGEKIVKVALDKFGGVQVLVCNAGVLRDKAFVNMTEEQWDTVMAVHLRGTFRCCKAVWPIFQEQKYGRILVTSSPNGIIGAHGQGNYASAKAGLIGFGRSLAIEGKKNNILTNILAPSAGTAMTATVWTEEMVKTFSPDFVAPVVAFLTSKDQKGTGQVIETYGGQVAALRWQRTHGAVFPNNRVPTPEQVVAKWDEITTFDDKATHPRNTQESGMQIFENFSNLAPEEEQKDYVDPEDPEAIVKAKRAEPKGIEYEYTERDVMLYNLGIGAHATELQWTYENDQDFQPLPTFGVIPQFTAGLGDYDFLPNYNPGKLLHGEQYLSIKGKVPTSGKLVNKARLFEVLDKGKAAAVTTVIESRDAQTNELIYENHSTVFIRDSGGFGGKRAAKDRGAATAPNAPPKRKPDAVVEEKTSPDQAALYRLSGDYNPLHIDPQFSIIGGFKKPILHGLCSMGFAGRHVLKTFGPYKDIKVRFAGTVIPGETLVTEMWKEGDKVIFQTKVKERDAPALSAAAVTLINSGAPKSKM